ncbi:TRAUB-domain-containing protein [Aspergillus sclerotioniger CBS 115572]|uniref:Protein BFR2 n=1 Tax=Aspergillus sclerotioniger CBS 115572 TaxID=1450535 RepID=A0A317WEW8_9EURO|nr:TRAUB-domain-containing protein [Aspergillus sclerotioniger CBS 115572]PWY83777.1 TRAUB-domain-containing protein [Aspergillus sclerotioniger CBS 115572]
MAKKSLAEQIAELEDLTPRDYDPEDLDRGNQDSDEEVAEKDASAGREHYQDVGKAKLRKQDPIALGKQYAGSKVSRDALEADSDDDPFAARSSDEDDDEDDEDEDEDEDEDLELGSDEEDEEGSESEEEEELRPSKAAKKAKKQVEEDDMDTDESDELDDSEGSFDDDDEIPSDEEEDDDDESESESESSSETPRKPSTTNDRDELRRLMATDQKTIAATISQAAKADAIKGKAVKQQRATFDALLNTRIKLQKGLTAINQLSTLAGGNSTEDLDSEAITSAESAALALWSTLEDLRVALADAQHNSSSEETKKRKRPTPTTSTSTATLWTRMTDLESTAHPHRRNILDKWSAKVRGANAATTANTRGKLLNSSSSANQQSIAAVLDAQVATETGDRAAKRARQDTTPEGPIYDDTVFYQSLLRDLVEQRMSSSDAITNGLDTLHIQLPTRGGAAVHPVTGMRKDKVKRDVDTRASKGRKMRFDVHEKLQNFMAPEERGSWTKHAREEFFASLLGKTASGLLREDGDDEEMSGGEESEEDREEGGLRLFRS